MDKFKKLQKEQELERLKIKLLEEQYELEKKKYEEEIEGYNQKMAEYYADFFEQKKNKEFDLIERYPSLDAFSKYVSKNKNFPLYNVGTFPVCELAILIKNLFQFERQREYSIFTIGINEYKTTKDHGWLFEKYIPHLYFFVGDEKTLEPFKKYQNSFINLEIGNHIFYSIKYAHEKNFISIPLNSSSAWNHQLDFQCFTGRSVDKSGKINYYDYLTNKVSQCAFSPYTNIFKGENEMRSLNYYGRYRKDNIWGYQGIKDVLSFKVHIDDSFLAKILISICIYKRNNWLAILTEEDYDLIFKDLYGESVDILGSIEKDFTRALRYIDHKELI